MNSQSAGPYVLSALLHGAAALLFVFFSYFLNARDKDAPKVFELVAGEGENYGATEAPALGSAGGITVPTPAALPEPVASPVPAAPAHEEPSPIQPAPEAPAKPHTKAPPKPQKPPDLLKQLKRVEANREKRLEAKYQKQKEAEAKRIAREQQQEAARAGHVAHIDAEGIAKGVVGGSAANKEGGAGGRALTREEGHELDAYFAELKVQIRQNHVPVEGASDHLSAKLECFVAADGSLSHLRIVESSGNPEFDRSVIEACERTHSIGPRPDHQGDTVTMTFNEKDDDS